MDTLGDSLKRIKRELSNVVHAAIENMVENAIVGELPFDDTHDSSLMGFTTEQLEDISEEPEVYRTCPFCNEEVSEHYILSEHIATEHPTEAIKKYEKSIKHYSKHPEDVGERHQMITKLFTGQERIYGDRILCPFCEQPYLERELKKHVNQQHGEFMETFYNVLKEG